MTNKELKFCVYMHTAPNGKRYIGITSKKPEYRWNDGKGYFYNNHFTKAIQKYGWENFKHEVLFENLTEDEANETEIRLIEKYQTTDPNFGYNSASGGMGRNMLGLHQSEETKKILSEKRKGTNNPFYGKTFSPEALEKVRLGQLEAVKKRRKAVVCLETGEVFESVTAAARHIDGDVSSLSACCRKEIAYHKNLHWRFADEVTNVEQELNLIKTQNQKTAKPLKLTKPTKTKQKAAKVMREFVKKPPKIKNPPKIVDVSGQRFGKLVALSKTKTKGGRTAYLCHCDCGNEKVIAYDSLRAGHSRSCGCLYKETNGSHHRTHGKRNNPLYSKWIDMKCRCYDSRTREYKSCGAKGIIVCDEWFNFQNFYDWAVAQGYNESNLQRKYTFRRKDMTKNYDPQNCFIEIQTKKVA